MMRINHAQAKMQQKEILLESGHMGIRLTLFFFNKKKVKMGGGSKVDPANCSMMAITFGRGI